MNWGNSITLSFVLFATFIIYMVVQAFSQNYDLVAEDYYAQEINYQRKLDQKTNLQNAESRISTVIDKHTIKFQFPLSHKPSGEIHFYHPFRKIYDQKIEIKTDNNNSQSVDREGLISGNYRVNITWKAGEMEYFQQEKIFLR